MTEFETVGMCILIVAYGCVFYMAGKAKLLDLVVLMIQDKTKELQEKLKGYDDEWGEIMASIEIPINVNLPDNWVDIVVEKLKKDENICIPVIRCKNCKWFGKAGCAINIVDDSDKPTENDFCSFAELNEEQEVK